MSLRLFRRINITVFLLLLCFTSVSQAQETRVSTAERWSDSVPDLSEKIVLATTPSRTINLSVENVSSLSPEETSLIEQDLRADLSAQGLKLLGSDPAATPVDVTFSQSIDGFLWVATIGDKPEPKVLIIKPLARKNAVEDESRTVPVLHRSVLLRQRQPILDFAPTFAGGSQMLLLLEPEQIAILQNSGNEWSVNASAAIHHSQPWPRDLRGHIVISNGDGFEAFLPGVHCTGTFSPLLAMNCQDSTAGWHEGSFTLSFVKARNYLSVAEPASNELAGVYSAALFADSSAVMTGTDGIQRFWANGKASAIPSAPWGDNVAAIAPSCGTDQQIVATGSGDWTQRDHLQSYGIVRSNTSPLGDALEFPGPITVLWASENGNSVRVISRSLETGSYEASIVSISCGN